MVFESIKEPLKQICNNSGVEFVNIFTDVVSSKEGFGYNARSGKTENLIDAGVIDPTKVLRCSLQNAVSSAGMILTTQVLIVDTL